MEGGRVTTTTSDWHTRRPGSRASGLRWLHLPRDEVRQEGGGESVRGAAGEEEKARAECETPEVKGGVM